MNNTEITNEKRSEKNICFSQYHNLIRDGQLQFLVKNIIRQLITNILTDETYLTKPLETAITKKKIENCQTKTNYICSLSTSIRFITTQSTFTYSQIITNAITNATKKQHSELANIMELQNLKVIPEAATGGLL